ncbi:MAG: nucleotidyltransferase domain-containing protein [Planctomycetes bacterium]|nr:nucleotidyltransferase domain-containing protein [Planctomycetota bacterium]
MIRMEEHRKRSPMLAEPIDEALYGELVDRIIEKAPDASVVLFGSRAHGDARDWSDVDLLVITETDRDPLM